MTAGCAADEAPVVSTNNANQEVTDLQTTPSPQGIVPALYSQIPATMNVLYVGNSYQAYKPPVEGQQTGYAVHQQVTDLLRFDIPGIQSTLKSIGGATLKQHWDEGNSTATARGYIESQQFDLLVIQGKFDILEKQNANRFHKYADLFSNLAKEHGMTMVIYGLWSTDDWISRDKDVFGPTAHNIYKTAAERNGASYAPNGMAYAQIYNKLSETLTDSEIEETMTADFVHPNIPLAYLVANIVYMTVLGKPPVSFDEYGPPAMDADFANLIRNIAWDATQTYGYGVP